MRFGRLVAIVVTTTVRFVLDIGPVEPPPVADDPCPQTVEEKATTRARIPGQPPCPRELLEECAKEERRRPGKAEAHTAAFRHTASIL